MNQASTASTNINSSNWPYCQYQNGDLRAFVSLGGRPGADGQALVIYFVTTSDKEQQEVYQTEHSHIDEALAALHKRYGHWNVTDMRVPHKEGGCGTCSAH